MNRAPEANSMPSEASRAPAGGPSDGPEVTVVMPCLNEAETLARCIEKAQRSFHDLSIRGEVVVADNGSTDGSQDIARGLGARVVPVQAKGYGHALRGGIEAALGRYVIMGDSDDSYDFSALEPFIERLREGYDLVMGNRFRGGIRPGAMPWKHRWIGNPVLTGIGRLLFGCPVGDFHCGLRGFRKAAYERMDLRTPGMEFASEMVIKSTLCGLSITEVPTILHKDGRSRPPHLRSWRDGWRHLRFMLLMSPLWLFLVPGVLLLGAGAGLAAWAWASPPPRPPLPPLSASLLGLLGVQILVFGVFAKRYAVAAGLHPPSAAMSRLERLVPLEAGLVTGLALLAVGSAWMLREGRAGVGGAVLTAFGLQLLFAAFFLGVLRIGRRS